ncbi:MAG TPA: aminoglycoside phosphotransferase family protein [Mycobacteriales bacterium]|nr:aminoglycoside phosphotransferase family protein [Mycobacteriales bacterium]
MHDDEVRVDAATAVRLITEQFPQWADMPVRELTTAATMNAIFRVGDSLAARFPLRASDPDTMRAALEQEAAAGTEFADVCPFPAPRPVALGRPGHGYPLPWSVHTWLPGRDALAEDPGQSVPFAEDLSRLLRALRAADTNGRRFSGTGRGGHLRDHDDWMELCFTRSEGAVDVASCRAMWAELRALPEVDDDTMSHGDLTPNNVLVAGGRLVGVLDTGGFAAADPALDLVSVWHLLDAGPRQVVRESLEISDVQWRRGMAWALQQAIGLVWYYATSNAVMSAWGRRTLDRLLSDRSGSPLRGQ